MSSSKSVWLRKKFSHVGDARGAGGREEVPSRRSVTVGDERVQSRRSGHVLSGAFCVGGRADGSFLADAGVVAGHGDAVARTNKGWRDRQGLEGGEWPPVNERQDRGLAYIVGGNERSAVGSVQVVSDFGECAEGRAREGQRPAARGAREPIGLDELDGDPCGAAHAKRCRAKGERGKRGAVRLGLHRNGGAGRYVSVGGAGGGNGSGASGDRLNGTLLGHGRDGRIAGCPRDSRVDRSCSPHDRIKGLGLPNREREHAWIQVHAIDARGRPVQDRCANAGRSAV